MKTYQNEHVVVQVDCSVHWLEQTWMGLPNSETFRDASLAVLALAKRHQVKRWKIDIQQLRLFNPVDIYWFVQHWLPQAQAGLPGKARVAIILAGANQFAKVGADMLIRAATAGNDGVSCRYFVWDEEADQWLRQTM